MHGPGPHVPSRRPADRCDQRRRALVLAAIVAIGTAGPGLLRPAAGQPIGEPHLAPEGGAAALRAEIIVDNRDPGFSELAGDWRVGQAGRPHGDDYFLTVSSDSDGLPTAEAEWRPDLPRAGRYEIAVWFVPEQHRSPDAPFTVEHAEGTAEVRVDQRQGPTRWVPLGTFPFEAGTDGRVILRNNAAKRNVIADAVRFRLTEAAAPALPSAPAPPEFRAMWITRFEWAQPDAEACRAYIEQAMARLARHHFNAVLFQVRGQADTLYPSPEEPWSPLIAPAGATPDWDPLAFAIDAAHRHGLEFHAYINTHVAWHDLDEQPPADPQHLFFTHCNADDPQARDWLVHNEDGEPVAFAADHYVWLAPGVPEVQAYIRRQVMFVVTNYDVDGVHFDRIRTPRPNVSHDPISVRRQRLGGPTNPADLPFDDWTRDQFTRMLTDLYAQVVEFKPYVKVSATPVGLYAPARYPGDYDPSFHYGYTRCHQDAQAWLAVGALDFIVPQIYWSGDNPPPRFDEVLSDWLIHRAGRHVYPGLSRRMPPEELSRQVRTTREQGAPGFVFFSYGGMLTKGFFDDPHQRGDLLTEPVPTPEMPWRQQSELGIIIGTVRQADSQLPLTDVQIRRTGASYVALSGADGLYAMTKVTPGEYTIRAEGAGLRTVRREGIQVEPGRVTRVDIDMVEQAVPAEPQPRPITTPPTKSPPEPPVPMEAAPEAEEARPQGETPRAEPPVRRIDGTADLPPNRTAIPADTPAEQSPASTGTATDRPLLRMEPGPARWKVLVGVLLIVLLAAVAATVAAALLSRNTDRP